MTASDHLSSGQFARLDDIEHGQEVRHSLPTFGLDPDKTTFKRGHIKISQHATHPDDYEYGEDEDQVHELAQHMEEGGKVPPVIAVHHEGRTHLLDGYHRASAAKLVGKKRLSAWIAES